MRFSVLLLALLVVPLAGCAGVPPASEVPAPKLPPAPPREEFLQTGCVAYYSAHDVPWAYATQRLPKGLAAYRHSSGYLSAGALFTVKTWTCKADVVGNDSAHDSYSLLYYLAVVPAEQFQDANVAFYWFPLEVISTSPMLVKHFASWGIQSVSQGSVTFETWSRIGSPHVLASAASDRTTVNLKATLGPTQAANAFTVRYFAASNGVVTGWVDIDVQPHESATRLSATLAMEGPDAPFIGSHLGTSSFQNWPLTELSYRWRPTTLATASNATAI